MSSMVGVFLIFWLSIPYRIVTCRSDELESSYSYEDVHLVVIEVLESSLPNNDVVLVSDFNHRKLARSLLQSLFAANRFAINIELVHDSNNCKFMELIDRLKQNSETITVVTLLPLQIQIRLLKQIRCRRLYGSNVSFVVVVLGQDRQDLFEHLVEGMNLLVIYKVSKWPVGYAIDIIEIDRDGKAHLRFLDRWVNKLGFLLHGQNRLPPPSSAYSSLNGRSLKVATIDNHPFFKVKWLENGEVVGVSGMELEFLQTLSSSLGFEYSLTVKKNDRYEYEKQNGSLNWLVHSTAQSNEADMAISEISITHKRRSFVDFSWPYFGESLVILTKKPSCRPKTLIVLNPFTSTVWMMVGFVTLAAGTLMYVLQTFYVSLRYSRCDDNKLTEWLWESFKILISQCPHFEHRGNSVRMLRVCWALMATVLATIYSSQLIGLMTTDSVNPTVDSLEDFLEALTTNDFELVIRKGSHAEEFFQVLNPGIRETIYAEAKRRGKLVTLHARDDYVGRVKEADGALFNGITTTTAWANLHGIHNFHISTEPLCYSRYGIVMRKGFPYRPLIDKQIKNIVAAGLMGKWWKNMMNGTSLETRRNARPNLSGVLHLDGFQGTFYIYLMGIIIAGLTLMYEIVTHSPCRI